MKKKYFFWMLVIACLVGISCGKEVFAYGEEIERSLTDLLNWVTKVLGGLSIGFGVVWIGIRMNMHDEHALKKGLSIIGGGILIFSAMNIVDLLKAIFQ